MKIIATFQTVENFWRVYDHLIRPNEFKFTTDYHLFKEVCDILLESSIHSVTNWVKSTIVQNRQQTQCSCMLAFCNFLSHCSIAPISSYRSTSISLQRSTLSSKLNLLKPLKYKNIGERRIWDCTFSYILPFVGVLLTYS